MFANRIILAVGLAGAVLCATGCGSGGTVRKTGKVSGKIDLDGKPLSKVVVTFENSTQGFGASATVKDGVYQFDEPLVIGEYKVLIQPPPPPAPTAAPPATDSPGPAIPKQYLKATDSGLKAKVEVGTNKFDFQLKS